MTTPPGWYPDPAHSGHGPAPERWWDGRAWTSHTPAATGASAHGGSVHGTRAGRVPLVAGVVGAVILVAALVVGSVLLFSEDGSRSGSQDTSSGGAPRSEPDYPPRDGGPDADPPGPEGDGRNGGQEGGPDPPPGEPGGPVTGVRLPAPDGWKRTEGSGGTTVTAGSYRCPDGSGERCLRAAATVVDSGTSVAEETPERVARGDVRDHAEESYSEDVHGGITSYEALTAGRTTVAGEDGYRVRWRIENRVEPHAYVESVAFPHPDGSGRMLVLRTGVDIHRDAPEPRDMDQLVRGLTRTDGTGGTDGAGGSGGGSEQVTARSPR